MRRELLTWNEVDQLIDLLIPQFQTQFDAMVMITRGGIVPGGLLSEALNIHKIFIAAVDFPGEIEAEEKRREKTRLLVWPQFLQFPENQILFGKKVLIVDDVWGSGRTITSVKNRIAAAMAAPYTCVLHFNPQRNLFGSTCPDFFAAITDAYIIYPWEIQRGGEQVFLQDVDPFS